jgi:hypothetical protein
MPLSDDDLLAFDHTHLEVFQAAPQTLLRLHGDSYRHQLVMARWLDRFRERRGAHAPDVPIADEMFDAGVEDALRDIAAHLRQGDFLPGGRLYEDEQDRGGNRQLDG